MPQLPACVYCRRRPVEHAWRPFCSERCKMADLGRWLGGDYRIAGAAATAGPDSTEEARPSGIDDRAE